MKVGGSSLAPKVFRSRKSIGCICSVCNKPATGMHYQVIACNGCRSFFRRSIAYNKSYVCKWTEINSLKCFEQHDCKLCRLKLCLAVGMKAEGVRTDEGQESDNLPDDLQEARKEGRAIHFHSLFGLQQEEMIRCLLSIEASHNQLRVASCGGPSIDVVTGRTKRVDEVLVSESTRPLYYEPVAIQLSPSELVIKYKMNAQFRRFVHASKKMWIFQDIVYSMELMKTLPIYHLLDDSSKHALLASAVSCCNISTAYYDQTRHSGRMQSTEQPSNAETKSISPCSILFDKGIISAMREVEMSPLEYILLKIIMICNPMLDGISLRDVTLLQNEKKRWNETLMSYVLVRRGIDEGPAYFSKIISIIDVVARLTAWEKDHHTLMLSMAQSTNYTNIRKNGIAIDLI